MLKTEERMLLWKIRTQPTKLVQVSCSLKLELNDLNIPLLYPAKYFERYLDRNTSIQRKNETNSKESLGN